MSLTSGNNAIDSLIYNSWQPIAPRTPVTLTYSFLTQAPPGASADDARGFAPMNFGQQQASRDAMAKWAAVANITFVEQAGGGKIQLGTNQQEGSSGYAYLPEPGVRNVYLYTSNDDIYNNIFTEGSYGPTVLLHELGHTLGLKHPGNYNSSGESIGGPYLPAGTDNTSYTQMSYHQGAGTRGVYATSPMLYDIQAIQYLYGANMNYHRGDDIYTFASRDAPECIWDAGGVNTFDFSACTGSTVINLNAGAFSGTAAGLSNISIAYNVTIQRAIGGDGGTTIYGNDVGNVLTGGRGVDTFYAGAGDDSIFGGDGNDTAVFSRSFDSYALSKSATGLTVRGSGTDLLTGVEFLRFSDRTVAVSEIQQSPQFGGTPANDRLAAGTGNETIDGGAGIDTVVFGNARSSYAVTVSAGVVTVNDTGFASPGGRDTLLNVERLQFADGALALDINGNAGQIYRMYRAAFDRPAEPEGQGYWIRSMDNGLSLTQLARSFIDSPEFSRTFGSLNNSEFVTLLYAQVLDRAPDAGGFDYHMNRLATGVTRAELLGGFSESPENQAAVIDLIGNGIAYTPYLG